MTTGDRIKKMRIQRGMSQEELAQKIGYRGRDSISKIEVGKAKIPTSKLNDIACALDCSTRYLLCEIDNPYYYGASVITEDELDALNGKPLNLQLFAQQAADPISVQTITSLARRLTEDKRTVVINVMENMI